ncbi:MAG: hypothetical protein FD138_4440 [Planctomycetota bacterium]|nr:MAG: hypothetical protein FD138_4440 [Planctomycetota bacterium]
MSRVVAVALTCCLCWSATQADAQGLLGKPYVSSQYMTFKPGGDFDSLETSNRNGGRIQGSIPLIVSEGESGWSCGMDGFGTFSGASFKVRDPSFAALSVNASIIGGDLGLNLFTRATEDIRPFVQLGVNWAQTEVRGSFGPFTFSERDTETSLIVAGGVEVDVFPNTALRASYGKGTDGLGGTGFLGELVFRPMDNWFGRFSVNVDKDENIIGGFGVGYAW